MAVQALAPRNSLPSRKSRMKVTVESVNGDPVLLRVEGRVSQRDVEVEIRSSTRSARMPTVAGWSLT